MEHESSGTDRYFPGRSVRRHYCYAPSFGGAFAASGNKCGVFYFHCKERDNYWHFLPGCTRTSYRYCRSAWQQQKPLANHLKFSKRFRGNNFTLCICLEPCNYNPFKKGDPTTCHIHLIASRSVHGTS